VSAVLVAVNVSAALTRSHPEAAHAFRAPRWVAPTGALAAGILLVHQLRTATGSDLVRLAVLLAVALGLWLAARARRTAPA
jgi:hypothetical protein